MCLPAGKIPVLGWAPGRVFREIRALPCPPSIQGLVPTVANPATPGPPPPSPGPAYLTGLDFSFPAASLCLAGSPWQLPLLLQQRDSPASRIARDGKGEAPTLEMRDILHSYSLTPS